MTTMSRVSRDAAHVTTYDRDAAADLVLGVAVREAVAKLRSIRHTSVEYRVARVEGLLGPAVVSADRILGRS